MASATISSVTPAQSALTSQDMAGVGSNIESPGLDSSIPVEMSHLSSRPEPRASIAAQDLTMNSFTSVLRAESNSTTATANPPMARHQTTESPPISTESAEKTTHSSLDRVCSTAIGPSSDSPIPVPKDPESAGPTLMITLLLTTGARHPFKIDKKYLQKRHVEVSGNDPFNLSVYKLKELILREWREGISHQCSMRVVYQTLIAARRMGDETIQPECYKTDFFREIARR